MDRNEELAESLKKHEHYHREIAEILMNAEARTEGIDISLGLILLSFQSYLYWEKKKTRPRWEWVNQEECQSKDDGREIESFLKANPLPEPHKEKEERARDEMKQFSKLLNDPKSAWKLIDGGKGGVR